MVAAAIVCAAAFAQAGAVSWSVANLPASPAGSIVASTTTYSAWLFIGEDYTVATTLLDSGDFSGFADLAVASRDSVATSKGAINFGNATYGSFASETVSAYAIILDTTVANMENAGNYLVAVNTSGDEIISQTFTTSGNKNFIWGNQTTNGATWQSIPEPTSGLLLLLGMAGLALRRRRA